MLQTVARSVARSVTRRTSTVSAFCKRVVSVSQPARRTLLCMFEIMRVNGRALTVRPIEITKRASR